ncbi:hypothetical protein [Azonexus sp.]|uniref:hypothetical protein n=1 Tax=Azonexus sp. TaxID=1872668 RepID=UPI0039E4610E
MVFSFFKKAPQKMPEPTAARPRMPLPEMKLKQEEAQTPAALSDPLPDLDFVTDKAKVPPAAKAPLALSAIDEFEAEFTESSVMAIDVEQDVPPLQADVEQVVVLFANDQDAAARSVLESLLPAYSGSDGIRLWRLLFDLLQVQGEQAAFEKRSVEFAQNFEISPPAWRSYDAPAKTAVASGAQVFALHGVLTEEHRSVLLELGPLLGKGGALHIDCSKLAGCDDHIAGMLADMLIAARRLGKQCQLLAAEGFIKRLDERLQAGQPEREAAWRLLLELLQWQGTQAHFEERAIDYAVTFERSPPSWENQPPRRVAASEPAPETPADAAIYLVGALRNQRFAELQDIIDTEAQPVIDFSGVSRLDFYSAGQLVNRLSPFKAAGKEVVIRSPNHLVAELMAVVGLNKQARIIVPKS